jgi:hypothetical protein
MDFRDLLVPASGSQGPIPADRDEARPARPPHRADRPAPSYLTASDRERLESAQAAPSISDQVAQWLERARF